LDVVADHGAADDAGRRCRGAAAATTELVTDQAADNGSENRTTAGIALADFDLVDLTQRAAGMTIAAGGRIGVRRRRSLRAFVIDDAFARRRRDAAVQSEQGRQDKNDGQAIA